MLSKKTFEKVLERVINKNSDRCSMCKRPFRGPCHTFGGVDPSGTVQNVGACCRSFLVDVRHGGAYTTAPMGTAEGEHQAKLLIASHPLAKQMSH